MRPVSYVLYGEQPLFDHKHLPVELASLLPASPLSTNTHERILALSKSD